MLCKTIEVSGASENGEVQLEMGRMTSLLQVSSLFI